MKNLEGNQTIPDFRRAKRKKILVPCLLYQISLEIWKKIRNS